MIENPILCEISLIHAFVKRYLIIKIRLYYITLILITVKINPCFLMFSKPDTELRSLKSRAEIVSLESVPIPRSLLPGISLRAFTSCKVLVTTKYLHRHPTLPGKHTSKIRMQRFLTSIPTCVTHCAFITLQNFQTHRLSQTFS